jgi:hypothetical protein
VADIFISYSKKQPQPTRDLAAYLESEGYSVWWDTNLTSGETFREVIDRELDAAKAVIVIWTAHSVTAAWVISEAQHAYYDRKLIPLRTRDLAARRIPKPFDTVHTAVVDDRAAVLRAVRRLAGVAPRPRPPEPSSSEPIKPEPPPRPSQTDEHGPLRLANTINMPPPTGQARRSSSLTRHDVFEGDAVLKELRSRLASAQDQTPEPPPYRAKTPFFAVMARLVGVMVLAAVGAFGFLWITSPRGAPEQQVVAGDVALVSYRALDVPKPPSVPAENAGAKAPPPPIAAPDLAPPPPTPDRDEVASLLARARTYLSAGDVAAARLVLRRAAERDDPQAALALGGTYDPFVLKRIGIDPDSKFKPDVAQASEWYRKAAELGSAEAVSRLEQLPYPLGQGFSLGSWERLSPPKLPMSSK